MAFDELGLLRVPRSELVALWVHHELAVHRT